MFSLAEMAGILNSARGAHLPGGVGGEKPSAVVIDSRQAGPGTLFVCIKGERVDGHDFITQAVSQGALAVLASRDVFGGKTPPLPVLWCDEPVKALGRLASAYRDLFKGLLIGLTGSAGKTSVKEVLSATLAVHGKTSKNYLNLNSQIGLPVSMLNADTSADYWVMEAGINEAHDMDELGPIMRPNLGMVLNVGAAHLSGLGDKGVAYYKTRLLKHMAPGGSALISADYPDLVQETRLVGCPVKYFSTKNSDAEYYASYVGPASSATGKYRVHIKGGESFEVIAPFRGAYGSENVAAITAAAHAAGLGVPEIIKGFSGAALPVQRFVSQTRGSFTLVDDSYNANPLSTSRMLEAVGEIAAEADAPLFLVMGEMLELGDEAEKAHRDLGRQMAAITPKVIIWKGGSAAALKAGLADVGFTGELIQAASEDDFAEAMKSFEPCIARDEKGRPKGVIMFKGSRGMKMELWREVFKNNYFSKLEE